MVKRGWARKWVHPRIWISGKVSHSKIAIVSKKLPEAKIVNPLIIHFLSKFPKKQKIKSLVKFTLFNLRHHFFCLFVICKKFLLVCCKTVYFIFKSVQCFLLLVLWPASDTNVTRGTSPGGGGGASVTPQTGRNQRAYTVIKKTLAEKSN